VIDGARRRDHGRAEMLSELNAKSRDAAGAALNQDRLIGFELCRIFNCGERGEAGEPQSSRLGVAETIGLLSDDRGPPRSTTASIVSIRQML
jgi:hypothetical protein